MSAERRARGPLDRRVLGLDRSLRAHLTVSAVGAVAVAAAVLAQAELLSRFLPELAGGDRTHGWTLAAGLVVVGVVRAAVAATIERSAARSLVATRTSVRDRVLDRVGGLRTEARRDLGPARVLGLTTTSVDALEPWVRSYLPGLVLAIVVPLAAGLRILGADLLSAVIVAAAVPAIPVFMILVGRATEAHAASRWSALQRLTDRYLDALEGMATLRLFGRASAQVARIKEVTDRYRRTTLQTLRVAFLSALVLELLTTLSVALVAVSLGIRLSAGDVDLRTALVVLLLVPECLLPIRRVSAAFHAAAAGTDAAADIEAALELPCRPDGTAPLPACGTLGAHDVTVVEPSRGQILAPVSLAVRPGEVVAVTGASGAGKSTLLDVVRGARTPTTGSVRLGSVPIEDLPAGARAQALTWVPQRPAALGDQVAGSAGLGHGAGPVVEAAVALALDQVGLGDQGTARADQLSGGQQRRLALARALVGIRLGTTRFLLLDEPTAQLDPASAALVLDAVRWAAASGVGVVVATHDERVIALADRSIEVHANRTASPPARGPIPAPTVRVSARPVPDAVAGEVAAAGGATTAAGSSLRWLLHVARPVRRRLVGAQLLGVAAEACTIGLAGTAAWLILRAAERPSFADLAVAAVAVRACGIGKGVLRYAERLASHDAALRLLADLRAAVIGRLAGLAPTGWPDHQQGDLLARLVDDVDRLGDLFLRVIGPMASTLVVATAGVAVVVALDPAAGAALGAAVAVAGLILPYLAFRAARTRGVAAAACRGRLAAAITDLAANADELAACGGAVRWRAGIDVSAADLDRLDRSSARTTAVIAACGAAAPALGTASVIAALAPTVGGLGGPAIGVAVLLPLAVLELVAPSTAAGELLARVEAAAARVRDLVQRPDPVREPVRPADPPSGTAVEVDGASLAWPGGPVQVDRIDLSVAAGDVVVVTGPSGSGKSTVAAALVRFIAPIRGRYRIGGTATDRLGGDLVRRQVTWCQQDPWFAATTLADNLRVARPTATDADLWAALATVHLDGWARSLPDGLATRLGRDAAELSGGERQRLALARALLGDRTTIVFDEPTAHLDGATADDVLRDLLAATTDRGVVVITHDELDRVATATHRVEPRPAAPSRWVADIGSQAPPPA